MHACIQCIRAPPALVCTAVIIVWQAQNGDPIRAYRSSKTPDKYVFSVIGDIAAILKLVLGHVR